ncbi:MAG: c-type cytochrome [Pseudomonadota bacterium]
MLKFGAVMLAATLGASGALAEGDVAEGEKLVAKRCKACHSITDGDNVILKGGKVGPDLFGVIGRQAGALEGYKFRKHIVAAGEQGLTWDETSLSDYIADPRKYLRAYLEDKKAKSAMTFKLKKEGQRADVAAYLASLSQ